jgi:hypothetical protein
MDLTTSPVFSHSTWANSTAFCATTTRSTGNHRFESLATTPQAIHDLLAGLAGPEPAKVVVVMETCDTPGWVYDIAVALALLGLAIKGQDSQTHVTLAVHSRPPEEGQAFDRRGSSGVQRP